MLKNLNASQETAATSIDGNVVVIAGPGSGKTTMNIQRYLYMISKFGISQGDILNLTFTRGAATEMVERVGLLNADKVFRTFHSFALDLLQRERKYVPFQMIDTIIPVRGEDFDLIKQLQNVYPAIDTFKSLKEKIEQWQSANLDPAQAKMETYNLGREYFYACAYEDFEKKCRQQGWLNFHSLMKETVKLLETNDDVRIRNTKKYISVDECQDTDVVQFQLLKLIYGGNIFVVGDENQLIYEWRSAQSGNLSNFSKTFPGSKTLYLGENYRSTQRLVAFFKKILPVDNGLASHMVSMREEGTDPTFTKFLDDVEEGSVVLSCVTDAPNTAIIARTNRQLMNIQKMCLARNIKSKILGRKNVWEQNEVKHLLDLAKTRLSDPRPAHVILTELMNQNNLAFKYRNAGGPMERSPIENLNDFIRMSARKPKNGTAPFTMVEFLDWLRKLIYGSKSDKKPQLTLSTVHQAKGREWKHVFVIGAQQGMMPHKDGELLEEHRILFVACTRAADTLDISFVGNISQFLGDFREEVEEYEDEREQEV